MAHIGVKNRTKEVQVLTHDGKTIYFQPDQVRLVEGILPDFVETRIHMGHPIVKNPKTGLDEQSNTIQGLRLFDVLSIDDALKQGARVDEDPRVLAARAEAEKRKKDRQELLSELKASLVEDGWTPPAQAKAGKAGKEVATHA